MLSVAAWARARPVPNVPPVTCPTTHRRRSARYVACALLTLATVVPAACAGGDGERPPSLTGTTLRVVAVWDGTEAANFAQVLDGFERRTGAQVEYVSTEGDDISTVLDAMVARGAVPDVAVLPQPGLLREYACAGLLAPMSERVGAEVRERYAAPWHELASVDGTLYGVWLKAANKSLVWYNLGPFERTGLVPPDSLAGLVAAARNLRASGLPAFAVAADDAWTLTDWFENVYLGVAGPAGYDELARRARPWTDPTVHATLTLLRELLAPELLAGGVQGARATSFEESVDAVFSRRPSAAMVVEGDFVRGVATGDAVVGVDVDVFPFPAHRGNRAPVVAGGDVAVLMRDSRGGRALAEFLASAAAGETWARLGGFVSPNDDVPLTAYPDDAARSVARGLLEAGDELRFDLSDLQPAAFGATTGRGMLAILQDFLADRDVGRAAARLEASAAAAYARRGTSACRNSQARASSAAG
jgi:alpha-glucoside transport system substrate-binding protein